MNHSLKKNNIKCGIEKIWIKENFLQWKKEKEDEQKIKLSESGRYKAYRRYMKSGGPGQMTFDPD